MATSKMTPEERALRKAARLALEAEANQRWEAERAAQLATFKAGLPKRLMDAQALASHCGIAVHIELIESGPSVRFEYEDHHRKIYIDSTLTYDSDEWAVSDVEGQLAFLKTTQDKEAARRVLAQAAFTKLTDDEKSAMKDYIHYLR